MRRPRYGRPRFERPFQKDMPAQETVLACSEWGVGACFPVLFNSGSCLKIWNELSHAINARVSHFLGRSLRRCLFSHVCGSTSKYLITTWNEEEVTYYLMQAVLVFLTQAERQETYLISRDYCACSVLTPSFRTKTLSGPTATPPQRACSIVSNVYPTLPKGDEWKSSWRWCT